MPAPARRLSSTDLSEAAIAFVAARGTSCPGCSPENAREGHSGFPLCEAAALEELVELVRRDAPQRLSESVAEQVVTGHLYNDVVRLIEAKDGSSLNRWRDVPPELRRALSDGMRGVYAQINAISRNYPKAQR